MDQRTDDNTVSAEQSMKRMNTMQIIFIAVLLTTPVIGFVIGCVVAVSIVALVLARSKYVAVDLAITAGVITLGLAGMIAECLAMAAGHVVTAYAADAALNYFILAVVVEKRLGHIFSTPRP